MFVATKLWLLDNEFKFNWPIDEKFKFNWFIEDKFKFNYEIQKVLLAQKSKSWSKGH